MTNLSEQRNPPTVLVAEDHEDSRVMLTCLLQACGYDVVEAGDGLQALEIAISTPPDLILMDLTLPHLDGLSVLSRLRERESSRATPIIIVSGHDAEQERARAMAAGCTAYFAKPIDFEQLEILLRSFERPSP